MSRTDAIIRHADFVESVAAALQYISYYHPADFVSHLAAAYEREESPAARDAMAQILANSRMCAEGHRPICQDTGTTQVFLKVGMDVRFEGFPTSLADAVDEAVRLAWLDLSNRLRASIVTDVLFERGNTGDNTPAVVHVEMVPGAALDVIVMAKGGGSENKSVFKVLMPSDSIVDFVLDAVPAMGAGWCPPGMLGIGVGGTAERAMLLAKEGLTEPLDMHELKAHGPRSPLEALRMEIHDRVNALGIGAQGLGGLTTVLDVKIATYPTHASSKPVAIIPNCAATRHARFCMTGQGPVWLEPPKLSEWPAASWTPDHRRSRPVNLDTLTADDVRSWRSGETLLLTGRLLTGRDAAHQRIVQMLAQGLELPVSFKGRVLYYVGPVDAVRDEAVGPAGPTTSTRMDKFTRTMLRQTGLIATVGKAERGPEAIDAIKESGSAYLMATGGAAYLVSKAIKSARVLAFEDLGMEAIHEFEVEDMPVVVAVDALGMNVHETGPKRWRLAVA